MMQRRGVLPEGAGDFVTQAAPLITVHNRQRRERIDIDKLRRFARRALPLCLRARAPQPSKLESLSEIQIILISDRRMRELHRRFFQLDGPTDVITFQHGEIFVSVETARRQAPTFGTSLLREIELYIVHGLLHLHGFSDKTRRASRLLNTVQKRIARTASK